jgi:aspartyl-tRNA(Asn)/glutamyl-tRNA(Gln) amidotransferase subunit A
LVDRDRALEQARQLDDELNQGNDRGPLHGIPIGIKDIIDVAGLPTAAGTRRWAAAIAGDDAAVVKSLREKGAVIMGKTVTTPYAWIDPPLTRNPWNVERSPGGSSSGSAAAVACGMCYCAVGTQTGGSITRPSSFCGVAGMKPSKNSLPLGSGIRPFSESLDHVGPIARTPVDLGILYRAMKPSDRSDLGEALTSADRAPCFGRLRGFFDRRLDPAVRDVIEGAVRALAGAGAAIVELEDPVDFDMILKDHRTVMATEAAQVHSAWLDQFPDDYPPRIRELVVEGRAVLPAQFARARDGMTATRERLEAAFADVDRDFWITPATVGTATDPSTTGDPAYNSPWSYMGLPTVSFPVGCAGDGLPVALQLVGRTGCDLPLLSAACWCDQLIRSSRQ